MVWVFKSLRKLRFCSEISCVSILVPIHSLFLLCSVVRRSFISIRYKLSSEVLEMSSVFQLQKLHLAQFTS